MSTAPCLASVGIAGARSGEQIADERLPRLRGWQPLRAVAGEVLLQRIDQEQRLLACERKVYQAVAGVPLARAASPTLAPGDAIGGPGPCGRVRA